MVQVLKATLIRHGFTFTSETDTEVIPKLAKFVYDNAIEGTGNFYCLIYMKFIGLSYVCMALFFTWTKTIAWLSSQDSGDVFVDCKLCK
jgi:hypothetical protein